jgi:hypothetical protein
MASLSIFYRGLDEAEIQARLAGPLLDAERVVALAELQRRERVARARKEAAAARSPAPVGRVVLKIAVWILLYCSLHGLVSTWLAGKRASTGPVDALIVALIVSALFTAAGLFRRRSWFRVLLRLVAIALMLALTLPLAWLSSIYLWGHG